MRQGETQLSLFSPDPFQVVQWPHLVQLWNIAKTPRALIQTTWLGRLSYSVAEALSGGSWNQEMTSGVEKQKPVYVLICLAVYIHHPQNIVLKWVNNFNLKPAMGCWAAQGRNLLYLEGQVDSQCLPLQLSSCANLVLAVIKWLFFSIVVHAWIAHVRKEKFWAGSSVAASQCSTETLGQILNIPRAESIVLYVDLWFSLANWPHGRRFLSLLNLSVFISFALLIKLASHTTSSDYCTASFAAGSQSRKIQLDYSFVCH